jgi:hypothetical protein
MRTGEADAAATEWSVPVALAWGLDLLPNSPVSLLPFVEVGAYRRSAGDERTGVTSVIGVRARAGRLTIGIGGRERLREAAMQHQFSVGLIL